MPTIDIPDKICSHCGGTKWKTEYRKKPTKADPDKKVIRYRCAKKGDERNYRWKLNHPTKSKEHELRNSRNRRANGYYKTPKEQERARLKSKRESDVLADNFIYRSILLSPGMENVKRPEIPQKLIDIKRKQLLLTRKLKQLENEKETRS